MKLIFRAGSQAVVAGQFIFTLITTSLLFSGTVLGANPLIQVWYGPNQSFGALGQPQQWVNVLGNVSDADGISSLSYSLNGGPSNALSLGPDGRRLAAAGDFNVELAFSELQVGANSVVITATDGVGDQATQVVTVNYSGVNAWPRSYSTDWASAATISDQAQIIDGLWSLGAGSVRPLALGYDRLLGIGDVTWDNFEATVPITVHGLDPACTGVVNPQCASDPGVGLLIRWQGHYDEDGSQPRWGYIPLGALGWMRWRVQNLGTDSLDLDVSNGRVGRLPAKDLPFEVPHMLKVRAETDALGHTYSVKLWEQGQPEPVGWDITGQDALSDGLSYGSLLLLAHHVDASFGDVTVTPLSTDTVAPVLSAIQASAADTSATITWTTDEPANSAVAHGPTSAYENGSVTDGFYVTAHSVTLTGLLPNTQYHYQVSSADGSANAASSVDLTFTTTDPGNPAGISTDLFDAGSLDTGVWSVVDPLGDSSVTMTGSQLSIAVPAGVSHDVWVGGNFAPRVMQPVNDADFEIEVKLDAPVDTQFQSQGMLVEQDSANFIRFDFYSDGATTYIFAATFNNGNPTTRNNAIIPGGAPLYMRVRREGDQWTQWYSNDGLSWVVATSFTHALSVTSVGVFAGNAGGSPPAHTALFDYFLVNPLVADTTPPAISNIQAVVTDTSATLTWDTDEAADSRVDYGLDSSYGSNVVDSTAVVSGHSVTLNGLTPGTLYHYQISSTDGSANTGTSADLTFFTTMTTGDTTPPVISNVQATVTDTTATVTWTTDETADSVVDYGLTTGYGSNVSDVSLVTSHSVTLTGLSAGTLYHYQVSSSDSSGNTASGVDLTLTTTAGGGSPSGLVSDQFDGGTLDTGVWTVVDPVGDGAVTVAGGQASISVPAGSKHDIWKNLNTAPRIRQAANDTDFQLEVKFDSAINTRFQIQGLVVEQDNGNLIRFDFYNDGSVTRIFSASFIGGLPSTRVKTVITDGVPLYLRVVRTGDLWTQSYSYDGANWIEAGSYTHALSVTSVGVFAGNAGSNPAHTALVDYFIVDDLPPSGDTTAPLISNEQATVTDTTATVTWTTDEAADSVVDFGLTSGYGSNSSNASLVTSHSLTLTGLSAGTLYHYQVSSSDASGNTGSSADLTFTTAALPDTTAPVISNVLVAVTDTTATVTWDTDEAADSVVDYGLTSGYGSNANNTGLVTSHSLTLTGLTPETLYHFQVSSSDASGNTASDTDQTFTTAAGSGNPSGLVSDQFDGGTLDTGVWTFVDPMADSTVAVAGGQASISVPAGSKHDIWKNVNAAPRIRQAANDTDFQLEVKFDSAINSRIQMQGLVVEQDDTNLIRFDFYNDGSVTRIFSASFVGGLQTVRVRTVITDGVPLYLRVVRAGDLWTQSYSYDGANWIEAGSYTHALTVTSVGVFAGNASTNPAHTGLVDYFMVNGIP